MPEVRARRDAATGLRGDDGDDDGNGDDEEGGSRGDRGGVAFPRVTGRQEVTAAPKQEIVVPLLVPACFPPCSSCIPLLVKLQYPQTLL